jgi:octaprenyl-diphosphate synthase
MEKREQIEYPVAVEFEKFKEEFLSSLSSSTVMLQSAIDKIMLSTGKHIRPLLVLLTAKACGKISRTTINSSVLLELLHTASLIHDDVIDETKQRRGLPSLNAFYDNRVSVLVGDYVLSSALVRSIQTGNLQIMRIVSEVGRTLSEGEIRQIEMVDEIILDEGSYLQLIEKKTAMLISACTEVGSISAGASADLIDVCRAFGKYLGFCFQIKDDIFDYYSDSTKIGKPTGNDIIEGKITLPLLYAINKSEMEGSELCKQIIINKDFTLNNIAVLIDFAKLNGGIEYAGLKMKQYRDKAVAMIHTLPDSDARTSLLLLADYIIERES